MDAEWQSISKILMGSENFGMGLSNGKTEILPAKMPSVL